jgi:ABC-type branched-subunit amino acid transport system permease subunit
MTYGGGIVVGVAASLAAKYFTKQPFTGLPSTVPYLFLIVVLLVVPVAKLPQRRTSLRSLIAEAQPLSRRMVGLMSVVGGAGLLLVPALVGPKLPVWTSALSYVVIFGSLALLVWTSGQISLCHMAFAAVGATTMSHMTHDRLPWLVALVLAGLFTVPIGALVAIPAIRLSGIYLALVTLGFGILMQNVVFGTFLMFGSKLVATAPRPHLGFINGSNDKWLYYIVLLFAAVTCAVLAAIYRGRLGRLLRAMAESPTMLSTHGLGVNMTRLIVFCVSAFFAGIGGALAITQTGAASGVGFGPISSLLLLAVLAICGTRLLRSSILAAAAIAILPGYVTKFGVDQQTFYFGLVAIGAALVIARRSQMTGWLSQSANSSADRLTHGPVRDRWVAINRPVADPVGVER